MAICRCRLSLLLDSRFLSPDSDLFFWLQHWGLPVAHSKKEWLSSVHAISTLPVCIMLLARPDSQFLCCTRVYFFVIFCSLSFSHILLAVICMQLVYVLCTRSGSPYNVMHLSSCKLSPLAFTVSGFVCVLLLYLPIQTHSVCNVWYAIACHSCDVKEERLQ